MHAVRAPARIVVRTPNWLGDLMMATAFLDAARARHPGAVVDLVVRKGFEALPLPGGGTRHVYDPDREAPGAFGAGLRSRRYDLFYVLPPSFSAAWMAWRSGAPERVGYRGQLRGWLLRPAKRHRAGQRAVHLVREYLDLLDPPADPERFLPRLDLPPGWVDAQLARLARPLPPRFAALAPGAIYGGAKEWPVAHYRELAGRLAREAGLPVLVVGTARERDLAESIRDGAGEVDNRCGETDLAGLAAVLSRAAVLVSNDSGAMHLAAALRRPQVALFGSTSPEWTGPLNPRAEVVSLRLPCAPCYRRECPLGHRRCLTEIGPGQVLEKAVALLDAGDAP